MEKYSNKNHKIKNEKIPIIGFGTEISNDKIKEIINKTIEKEKIAFRDFIINAIPELSQEGSERDSLVEVDGFKVIEEGSDELNEGKLKIKMNFSLPKGSYATVFIGNLFAPAFANLSSS